MEPEKSKRENDANITLGTSSATIQDIPNEILSRILFYDLANTCHRSSLSVSPFRAESDTIHPHSSSSVAFALGILAFVCRSWKTIVLDFFWHQFLSSIPNSSAVFSNPSDGITLHNLSRAASWLRRTGFKSFWRSQRLRDFLPQTRLYFPATYRSGSSAAGNLTFVTCADVNFPSLFFNAAVVPTLKLAECPSLCAALLLLASSPSPSPESSSSGKNVLGCGLHWLGPSLLQESEYSYPGSRPHNPHFPFIVQDRARAMILSVTRRTSALCSVNNGLESVFGALTMDVHLTRNWANAALKTAGTEEYWRAWLLAIGTFRDTRDIEDMRNILVSSACAIESERSTSVGFGNWSTQAPSAFTKFVGLAARNEEEAGFLASSPGGFEENITWPLFNLQDQIHTDSVSFQHFKLLFNEFRQKPKMIEAVVVACVLQLSGLAEAEDSSFNPVSRDEAGRQIKRLFHLCRQLLPERVNESIERSFKIELGQSARYGANICCEHDLLGDIL
eukprot:UC4_evm5s1043